jgi:hypothetical protein
MTDKLKHRELLEDLSRELIDKGLLVESGWISFRAAAISTNAPEVQLREMRLAFFAGAQHLLGSIMTVLDSGSEPTAADLKRMENINNELNQFLAVMVEQMRVERDAN